MKKTKLSLFTSLMVIMLMMSACSIASIPIAQNARGVVQNLQGQAQNALQVSTSTPAANSAAPANQAATQTPVSPNSNSVPSTGPVAQSSLLSAYEGTLESIYTKVNPSVVNISVIIGSASSSQVNPNSPFGQTPGTPQFGQALGSGFVWDNQGHIVTNDHVVNGATSIEVTFADGATVPAQVVGTDPYADLAVIKVDTTGLTLTPVAVADSTQVKSRSTCGSHWQPLRPFEYHDGGCGQRHGALTARQPGCSGQRSQLYHP